MMITGWAQTLARQTTFSTKQHNSHVGRCRVSVVGMDRFQRWISIFSEWDCISGHSQHPSLHCHQPLGVGFHGHDRVQEKLCNWCSPGNDHWPRLHHTGSRLALKLFAILFKIALLTCKMVEPNGLYDYVPRYRFLRMSLSCMHRNCVSMGSATYGNTVWFHTMVHHDGLAQEISVLPKRGRHIGSLPHTCRGWHLGGPPLRPLCQTPPFDIDVRTKHQIRSRLTIQLFRWGIQKWPQANRLPACWSCFYHCMERRRDELDLYSDKPHCWA
jgi:hypothetical protein